MSRLGRYLVGFYFVLACGLMGAATLAPVPGGQVAVFSWVSGMNAAEIVARANGQLMVISADGRVAVTPTSGTVGIAALYEAGADLVTAAWFAKACMALNIIRSSDQPSEVAR